MDSNLINDFKKEMFILRYIPVSLAILQFLYIIFQFLKVDLIMINALGGIGFIPILFLLLSSHVFKFCILHRLPLYYILIIHLLCLFDFYIGIPVNLTILLLIHILLFLSLIGSIIYFKYCN